MLGFAPFDYALLGLWAVLKLGLRRTLLVAFGLASVAWVSIPQPCGCIRLPLQRCDSTPRFAHSAVRSDARNLMSTQEIHYSEAYAFATDLDDLDFVASDRVEVLMSGTAEGWRAWITHEVLDRWEGCMVEVRRARPDRGEAGLAEIECKFS